MNKNAEGSRLHRIGLGTAQFGMPYGISNTRGQIDRTESQKILSMAKQNGIELIDTAATYGESEQILGELLGEDHRFRVITKTLSQKKPLESIKEVQSIFDTFVSSLKRLKQQSVYALLVHAATDLFTPAGAGLVEMLQKAQQDKQVEKIGVSVYDRKTLEQVLNVFTPDIIQAPVGILDQRLLQSGLLYNLHDAGVEIHARSVFLQGLLLMPPDQLDKFFAPIQPHLEQVRSFIHSRGETLIEGALHAVLQHDCIDAVIVGVTSAQELQEVCIAYRNLPKDSIDYSGCALSDELFLNPSRWQLTHRELYERV